MSKLIVESTLNNINLIKQLKEKLDFDFILSGHNIDNLNSIDVIKGVHNSILSKEISNSKIDAFDYLEAVCKSNEKIKMICVESMSTLAVVILAYPQYKECFEEIILLQSDSNDSVNLGFSSNGLFDVEALSIVLNSKIKIKMISNEMINKSNAIVKTVNNEDLTLTKLYGFVDYDFNETRGCIVLDRRNLLKKEFNIELVEEKKI